jgi:hypothetical protein
MFLGLLLQISLPQNLDISDIFNLVAGIFAIFLFAVSLIAWLRRRQRPFLLVSFAFLVFFLKVLLEIQPIEGLDLAVALTVLDVVFLSLFFLAIVAKPRR